MFLFLFFVKFQTPPSPTLQPHRKKTTMKYIIKFETFLYQKSCYCRETNYMYKGVTCFDQDVFLFLNNFYNYCCFVLYKMQHAVLTVQVGKHMETTNTALFTILE